MPDNVVIREVGLRDGLQIIKEFMPTEHKIGWCQREYDAGIREMEVCSFVPVKYIPQFSDADELVAFALTLSELTPSALAPNLKGVARGMDLGVPKITCIVSASDSFNHANVKRPTEESLEEFRRIASVRDGRKGKERTKLIGGVSCTFGCTIEGRVAVASVMHVVEELLSAGADEIALADTVGYGDPALVRNVFSEVAKAAGDIPMSAHFHNTRGTGLANVVAALECGVRIFDSSIAGLGGCPNSPGATGNIATEDLAFMLEAMGFDTGVDPQGLIEVRQYVKRALPNIPMFGHIGDVGLPKSFRQSV
ncbi:hydroxymethylglutaryl-CoA lyase [Hyphococcus flavus]|uniref:Hydroxymethylglutaryl-CoA lyase n=1 Tax=Hyphococcus flavus TaxID=1866326 RepID=A0AAE9ZC41_9PROT|nr:hydroxymethylglutaryl-CoA lyase [Hyphococcus flavus]WDI30112.1 hydroxymethylglutaryl-CoA lyase [Hyphococcus flavus]